MSKKAISLVIISVLLFAFFWFIIRIPYRPDLLYSTIPLNANLVTVHHNLATRWKNMLTHPSAQILAKAFHQDETQLQELTQDKALENWIQRLCPKRSVFAYTQKIGKEEKPTWLFSTWIGYRNLYLPVLARLFGGDYIQPLGQYQNHQIWKWIIYDEQNTTVVLLTAKQGILWGCVSEDETVLHQMINAMEGQEPSSTLKAHKEFNSINTWAKEYSDFGMLNVPFSPIKTYCGFRATNTIEGNIAGDLCFRWSKTRYTLSGENYMNKLLDKNQTSMLGKLSLHPLLLQDLIKDIPVNLEIPHQSILATAETNKPLALVLLGDQYSGRLTILKIPAFLFCLETNEPEKNLRKIISQINEYYGLRIKPETINIAGQHVYALNGIEMGRYAMRGNDRPACIVLDKKLLLSSSLNSLKPFLENVQLESATSSINQEVLHPSSGYLTINVEKTIASLKPALGAYTMSLMFDRSHRARKTRKKIKQIEHLFTALTPLKHVGIRFTPSTTLDILSFELAFL